MNHHFIPALLVSQWGSNCAWKLVGGHHAALSKLDRDLLLNQKKKREWPVCVQRKQEQNIKRRFTRSTAAKVFFADNLYSIPRFSDPLDRALAWLMFQSHGKTQGLLINSLADLLTLAPRYTDDDSNATEAALAMQLERPLARTLRTLYEGKELEPIHYRLIVRFILASHWRNPAWKDAYYPTYSAQTITQLQGPTLTSLAALLGEDHRQEIYRAMHRVLICTLYQSFIGSVANNDGNFLEIPTNLIHLRAVGDIQFVIGDNPARTWLWDHPDLLHLAPLPSLGSEGAVITHPFGPRDCLLLHAIPDCPPFHQSIASEENIRRINTAQLTFAKNEVVYPSPKRDIFLPGIDPDRSMPWSEPPSE